MSGNKLLTLYRLVVLLVPMLMMNIAWSQEITENDNLLKTDTTGNLQFPFEDEGAFQFPDEVDQAPIYLDNANNIKYEVDYDPLTGEYIFYQKVGDMYYRLPKSMTLKDYVRYDFENSIKNYWNSRTEIEEMESQRSRSLIPELKIKSEAFNHIFGSDVINIRPQGFVEVQFGYRSTFNDDPNKPERLRRVPTFDFDNTISMSVDGKIGDKVNMRVAYNTEATFDYENKMNIDYNGDEDEIVKRIEAGNVSLPLNGSLIQGGTNLMGLKTELQFGRLNVTTVISQSKGESKVVESEGGAQQTQFEIKASEYDANRHFFLSKYFRDKFESSLSTLPVITSQVTINKIEVWITNKTSNFESARDIVAFVDLGEQAKHMTPGIPFQGNANSYPQNLVPNNAANNLYQTMVDQYPGVRDAGTARSALAGLESQGFKGGTHWEKIEKARKLNSSEYQINKQLGIISLNSALNNDEVLAIAYDFTINGEPYQVGEFTTDGIESDQAVLLKLLKGTSLSPSMPTWDLMMKNIYNLGAYDLNKDDFILDVTYMNDSTGTDLNYLPEGGEGVEGEILLRLLNLDNLNSQQDPYPDGIFDYIEGITINKNSGRVMFPVLEPFGYSLSKLFDDPVLAEKYGYNSLYDSTQTFAEQDAEHNKYTLSGEYSGTSGSEISLGTFNLTEGSVKVTAGGVPLTENVDYTVDYTLGRVKIINQSYIEAGTPIQVSVESQDIFSMQRKTLIGTHANYQFSDNFNIGGTFMWLNERPITNKVDYGEIPVSNMMLGADLSYRTKSKFLTNMVNYLPFYESDQESSISIEGEVAKLYPGQSSSINNAVYIDDFEGAEIPYQISNQYSWVLASAPQGQPSLLSEANLNNDLAYGYNRAKLAWYTIDRIFTSVNPTSQTPDHLKGDLEQKSNHFVRDIYVQEIYPDKKLAISEPRTLSVLNLAYYPEEKGPYNYDAKPTTYSAGIDEQGKLKDPESRWGGIMRKIDASDFESANIEYIEFWMMDPFIYDTLGNQDGGDLYFNLGNISEDILKDSRKSFENGLPLSETAVNVDTTAWGRVSNNPALINAFDNENSSSREYQDVGLDGLRDEEEQTFFNNYLQTIQEIVNPDVYNDVLEDPSNDNYHYFRGGDYDDELTTILDRYKNYNGMDQNSPTDEQSDETYQTSRTNSPDIEDINKDNTLSEFESYYQYQVSLRKNDMQVGNNYIVGKSVVNVELMNGNKEDVTWYQFKIPVKEYDKTVGSISDFKSIRFIRMFMKDFAEPMHLRFATLELVRSDWRRYTKPLYEEGITIPSSPEFTVTSVSIEEHANREPINYVLPPEIEREIDPANPQQLQMNEQSMVFKVQDLEDGDAVAAYKSIGLDYRQYKRLRMEVHAEKLENIPVDDGDLYLFVRMGSDYNNNYYEYEVPLKLTEEGYYNNDNLAHRYAVWPEENRLNLDLDIFPEIKVDRDAAMRMAGSEIRLSDIYEKVHSKYGTGENIIKVKGSPNLGNVEVMMIGIRNKKQNQTASERKSIEVWINELRLSEMDEQGGWASNARVMTRLADLGSVTFASRTRSVGFGALNQTVDQRSLEDVTEIDIAANVDLGRILPEKAGVSLPMFYGYSKSVANPEYYPLNPDVKMVDALKSYDDPDMRDTIKLMSQTVQNRKSLNFTNIMVEPQRKNAERKPMPWDIENFSGTYSFNEMDYRDIDIEEAVKRNERAALNYNYALRSQPIEPFKKIDFLNGKAFRLIKDFNFYLLPEQISFRTDLTRNYLSTQRRVVNEGLEVPTTVQKDFLWNRYFDFRFNLSRSLRLNFSNSNALRVDEPFGVYPEDRTEYQQMQKAVLDSLLKGGRPVDYSHNFRADYTLPINKIPGFEWISASANYRGTYDWNAGPITNDTINFGNTVQNTMNLSANATLNFTTLYNKVPYLRNVNQKYQSSRRSSSRSRYGSQSNQRNNNRNKKKDEKVKKKEVTFKDKHVNLKADIPTSVFHKLNTTDVDVKVTDKDGKAINGIKAVVNENRLTFTAKENHKDVLITVIGQVEKGESLAKKTIDITTRMLMMVRSVTLTGSRAGGTVLPGYMPEPSYFGMGNYNPMNSMYGSAADNFAPAIPFLLGWQDPDFGIKAGKNSWVTKDTTLNSPYLSTTTDNISLRANVEPLPNLRVDLTGEWRQSSNSSKFLNFSKNRTENAGWKYIGETVTGNFSMSIMSLKTAFERIQSTGADSLAMAAPSKSFENFNNYREIVAQQLANQRAGLDGTYDPTNYNPETNYPDGYGPNSPEVIIPAFLAAYTGEDPRKIGLDMIPKPTALRPNWRVNYNAMGQNIDWMKNIIQSITFSHAYRSSYSTGGFVTNLAYDSDGELSNGFSDVRYDQSTDFMPKYDVSAISIREQFSPLINMDVQWLFDLQTRVEYKKSRDIAFSFASNTLTEMQRNEFVIGVGYRFTGMDMIVRTRRNQQSYSNDLNLRFDLSLIDTRSSLRYFNENDITSAGYKSMALTTTADYMLSDKFSVQLYFKYNRNDPFISSTYLRSETEFGLSFNFSLTE